MSDVGEGAVAPHWRAGDRVDDLCRACKIVRYHTVLSTDGQGHILRVVCDWCKSHHNWRGGEIREAERQSGSAHAAAGAGGGRESRPTVSGTAASGQPFALVSPGERRYSLAESDQNVDMEMLMRRVIREELGLTPVVPAEKWRGGTLALRPGREGLQEKTWPIETFFHKIVMLRNRLRVMEQQLGSADLPEETRTKLLGYITSCYGTLTSFNVLFAEEADQFKGSGGKD